MYKRRHFDISNIIYGREIAVLDVKINPAKSGPNAFPITGHTHRPVNQWLRFL